jgi:TRAP-type mannitol/chloroaromatic compound transport system permease large subunit
VSSQTITTPTIYRGVIPFVVLQLIGLTLVIAFPEVVNGTITFFRSFW